MSNAYFQDEITQLIVYQIILTNNICLMHELFYEVINDNHFVKFNNAIIIEGNYRFLLQVYSHFHNVSFIVPNTIDIILFRPIFP